MTGDRGYPKITVIIVMTVTHTDYPPKEKRNHAMPYAILRFQKRKAGGVAACERHNERKKEAYKSNPDIDVGRSKDNYHLVKPPRYTYKKEINQMVKEAGCKVRKDSVMMVDSNIQREDILPSEKARAYKMKYEAMKHQGKKSGRNTLDEVGEAAGENAKKVQRYIWLSRLSDELLAMVDGKKLGFSQGVDISFLAEEAQSWVQAAIEEKGCNVSMAQSAKIKEYGKTGELTLAMVRLILTEEKPKERKVTLKADKISEYFAEDCSSEEIEGIIIQLLDEWKKRQ